MATEFYITEDNADRRVDRLLRTMFPQVPLGMIMKAIRTGLVRLDAKKITPDTRLAKGQFLQVPWQHLAAQKITSNIEHQKFPPLDTIYKDENIWIINKPAGLLSQPDVKRADSVFTRAISELNWQRADFHPSTVQRLDRNTSGIICVALSGIFQRLLTELIRERKIAKIYRAVVEGNIAESGKIDFPLLKDAASNIVSVNKNGQPSVTLYEKLCGGQNFSCAEIRLVTGRSHQIRAHFSAIGHPVIGDKKYGSKIYAKRTLLHAYRLKFPKDDRLEKLSDKSFIANIPQDMIQYFTPTA